MKMSNDKLYDFFGVEKLTQKTITVNGREFKIRIPTVGEMAILTDEGDDKQAHAKSVNTFAMHLIEEFPKELDWDDVLAMPATGARAITDVVTAVLNAIAPSADEVRGN